MMKACVIPTKDAHHIDDLEIAELNMPILTETSVLVKVEAGGLNPVDVKLIASGNSDWAFPHTIGLDVAGTVQAVGSQVTDFKKGDRVAGHGNLSEQGCLAEFVSVPTYQLAHIPDNVSTTDASALLCGAMTAYQAIFRKLNLANKQTILIHAGSGGVGSMAIQFAKLQGLTVITTCSSRKRDFVSQLNPDIIIDYQTEDIDQRIAEITNGLGVDAILNTIGKEEATKDLARLAYNGSLVSIVASPTLDEERLALINSRALSWSVLDLGGAHRSNNPSQQADLGRMAQDILNLASQNAITANVSKIYSFDQVREALTAIQNRETVGKVVLTMP